MTDKIVLFALKNDRCLVIRPKPYLIFEKFRKKILLKVKVIGKVGKVLKNH